MHTHVHRVKRAAQPADGTALAGGVVALEGDDKPRSRKAFDWVAAKIRACASASSAS
jgi:hypothetical protein